MEPLKYIYNEAYITSLANAINAVQKIDVEAFKKAVFYSGWDELELKARMKHITQVLNQFINGSYPAQLKVICEISKSTKGGLEGMGLPDFIEQFGIEHWKESMAGLEVLTAHSTGEFAVRPFLELDIHKGMKQMLEWSLHSNFHVRRLASEGCRPRLPWGMALKELKSDPSLLWPVLENLLDDQEEYVRRSVANNLNDISKDHPDLVLRKCAVYLKENASRKRLIKHALRGLLKQAHPKALRIFNYSDLEGLEVHDYSLDRSEVKGEGSLNMNLEYSSAESKKLRIEYLVGFMKANGKLSTKVFQWSELEDFSGRNRVSKKHSFKDLTTRKHYSGLHSFSLRINGQVMAEQKVELKK